MSEGSGDALKTPKAVDLSTWANTQGDQLTKVTGSKDGHKYTEWKRTANAADNKTHKSNALTVFKEVHKDLKMNGTQLSADVLTKIKEKCQRIFNHAEHNTSLWGRIGLYFAGRELDSIKNDIDSLTLKSSSPVGTEGSIQHTGSPPLKDIKPTPATIKTTKKVRPPTHDQIVASVITSLYKDPATMKKVDHNQIIVEADDKRRWVIQRERIDEKLDMDFFIYQIDEHDKPINEALVTKKTDQNSSEIIRKQLEIEPVIKKQLTTLFYLLKIPD